MNMKKRTLSLALALCLALALLPAGTAPAAAAEETLFERYIPIAQVYSATATPYTAQVGENYNFEWGTQLVDENYESTAFAKVLHRKDYQGHFLKVSYLGTLGSLDKEAMKKALYLDDTAYAIAMGTQAPEGNYQKSVDKDSIIVKVDLYDANKTLVQNISPACAILAVGPEGEFLTWSGRGGKNCSLFFSMQDNLCKITDDRSSVFIHFTPAYTWLTDRQVAEALLGSKGTARPQEAYEFIQYPALSQERPQYMTNNILSGTEFIDPFGTYYQVGGGDGLDPVVRNRIENVVDYSEYGRVLSPGETQRSILTADGTLYGVNNLTGEKKLLATGVKQAGKAHYMTADGTVKETDSGKVVATGCAAFAEHRFAEVIGVLKQDGSLYLGYTYLAEYPGNYEKGLQKMTVDNGKTDKFKAIVACGAVTEDDRFFRWHETVTPMGYDEEAWAQGSFIQRNDYELSLAKVTDKAARVFPYEYFTEQESTAMDAITGFVVNEDGYVWGFGLHRLLQLSDSRGDAVKMGMIKHIFPIYQTRGKFGDNANFVAFLSENDNKVNALVANHCTNNRPEAGQLPVAYLSDVPGGYKGVDGYTYRFDMESSKSFAMMPTEFHYLDDLNEVFHAMNTSTRPISNMDLLPNVARSSYRADGRNSTVVLLERTDGSMWMTQVYSKVSAADTVAKLGGWENTNAIQITQPTNKVSGRCDYVDLVGGDSSTVVNRGPVDAPSTEPKTTFMVDPNYVNISEYRAEKMYQDGEKFVLLCCSQSCGWCKRLKRGLPATLSNAGYSVYGTSDNTGALNFYWDFVTGSTLGTPYAVIVNGKDDVEVVSAIHSQDEMMAVIQKAKSKGIPSAVAADTTTPTVDTGTNTPTVEAKRPSDKLSLSADEWEVLKLVNQERYKAGLELLSMPAGLQTACDVRETELVTVYDHVRPNGQAPSTAIPESFPYRSAAENIAEGQRSAQEVMRDWMNSSGHKANILREKMGYLGVGVNTSIPYHWVQLFTIGEVASVTSSSGSLTFPSEEAMQAEYLICTGKNGVESYLPIDMNAMTRSGNSYTLKLSGKTVTLQVGPSIPATGTAYPSTQMVELDGKKVEFQMYALKDPATGSPTNYVKIRDLALALNGTQAQFNVGWDQAAQVVSLTANAPYTTANGTENMTPFRDPRPYTVPSNPTMVNGQASDLTAIYLVDDAGGGYTYYQLRDLGRKLGFNVDWSQDRGVFIETGKPYSGQ